MPAQRPALRKALEAIRDRDVSFHRFGFLLFCWRPPGISYRAVVWCVLKGWATPSVFGLSVLLLTDEGRAALDEGCWSESA
jgi:hypothetical protein